MPVKMRLPLPPAGPARTTDTAPRTLSERRHVLGAVAVGLLAALTPPMAAQTLKDPTVDDQIRTIPDQAVLGRLVMGVFPDASIDGKAVRFSPAARILDRGNVAIVPSMVTGTVWVRYRREFTGLVQTVWILTDDELASARRRR